MSGPRLSVGLAAALLVALCPGAASAQSDPASARVAAAARAFREVWTAFTAGAEEPEAVYRWSVRWLEAQREQQPSLARDWTQAHLDRMLELSRQVERRVATGAASSRTGAECAYYLAEARLWRERSGP